MLRSRVLHNKLDRTLQLVLDLRLKVAHLCSAQKWVGQGPPVSSLTSWSDDWQAVAIKARALDPADSPDSSSELQALQTVQQAMQHSPELQHVVQLVDHFTRPAGPDGQKTLCLVTR